MSELPGEPFGRAIAGQSYAVVGVAHDDTLNVRTGPGPDFAIVAELQPDGATIATGRDRLVPSGLWVEVQAGDVTGWASYRFLGLLGSTDDVTSRIVADNDGVIPTADSMAELGAFVAASRASVDPASRITVLGPPGDQLEMTVDVIGVGDDSVKGERLVIFAQSLDDGGGVSLYAVEATIICDRGVDDGICV